MVRFSCVGGSKTKQVYAPQTPPGSVGDNLLVFKGAIMSLIDAAVSVLTRAVELDQTQSYSEALVCYQEGLALLMNVLKDTKDDANRAHYRAKMESYIERAEKLKRLVSEQKEAGTFHEKVSIKEGSIGYSYRRVFEKYLEEDVKEVVVEDPYIRNVHQIYNFLRFCELLVSKGTVRKIKLLTSKKIFFKYYFDSIGILQHIVMCDLSSSGND